MRKLILAGVILQITIILTGINGQYEFGDIISFKRGCSCLPLYKHFAVYVDNVNIEGKLPGQDIFHCTGPTKSTSNCGFGVLGNEIGTKENYLDDNFTTELNRSDFHDRIISRITEKKNNCRPYKVRSNNCEHLATYVRYGERFSQQPGTIASLFCKRNLGSCEKYKKLLKEMEEDAQSQIDCEKCPDNAAAAG
uniref:LRAT domain-containing protein n=1 Tax=Seriola lalandi dorsalis TaxID=1841481 RepID=A0A3B4XH56_SERLL